jgi:hypothetical protein
VNPLAFQIVRLAHLDAQSFWGECYTDLYDFCGCLMRRCAETPIANHEGAVLGQIFDSSDIVMKRLEQSSETDEQERPEVTENLIVRSDFVGPEYQYSHGMSVYFPWAEPENHHFWNIEYPAYKFNEQNPNGWVKFLKTYFEATMRPPVRAEINPGKTLLVTAEAPAQDDLAADFQADRGETPETNQGPPEQADGISIEETLLEEITIKIFNERGQLNGAAGTLGFDPDKPGGSSATGIELAWPGIKNYPSFTRPRQNGNGHGNGPSNGNGNDTGSPKKREVNTPTPSSGTLQLFQAY